MSKKNKKKKKQLQEPTKEAIVKETNTNEANTNEANINEEISNYIQKYKSFISKDIYITDKMYTTFLNKYKYLYPYIHHTHPDYKFLKEIVVDKNKIIKAHNRKYLDHQLQTYDDYFNRMFPNIQLDIDQKKAIICEEDNLLVISGAGSGKTTTMAAKVKYLIDICHYKPKDIAVISFTNKACDEIKHQIHNQFNYHDVDIYTFHKLGLKILRSGTHQKLDIASSKTIFKIFTTYIKQELFPSKEKFDNFYHAFQPYLNISPNYQDFETFQDYHDYMYKRKYTTDKQSLKTYLKKTINKRRLYNRTIKGEYVKSKEEVDIANFLYLNGINYEYEKIYNSKEPNKQVYKPDFYIYQNELYNYIEHLGIDDNFNNNSFTPQELDNYLNSLKLKSELHHQEQNQDLFIITNSSMTKQEKVTYLSNALKEKGYILTKTPDDTTYETLKNTSEDIYFYNFIEKLLIPFISYFKNSSYTKETFLKLKDISTPLISLQIEVIMDFYSYYETYLNNHNLIDFDDMITKSYQIIDKVKEKDLGVDYKYLIIDEYQDISQTRYNLINKLCKLFHAKIFAVGDDYQTIFSFSGARIDIFTNFKQYLNSAKLIPIENTYRNSEELLTIATDFINKNQKQIKKKLKSSKHLQKPVEIYVYNDEDPYYKDVYKTKALDLIMTHIHPNKSTLLLGRYKKDIDSFTIDSPFSKKNKEQIIWSRNPKQKINFLTIHASKGLGFDEVVLLNAVDDKYGFPCQIEDEPLIKLIKPPIKEPILFPEERRLFYVALTRTKNKLYIICPKSKVSTFVKEISHSPNIIIHKEIIE